MEQKPEIAPRIRRVHAQKYKEHGKYGKSTYATGVLRVVALLSGSLTEFCLCTAKADYRSGSKMKFAFPHRFKDAKCTNSPLQRARKFRAFPSYHTLADDYRAEGPARHFLVGLAANDDQKRSFVDFRSRWGISYARSDTDTAPPVTRSPICVQLSSPTLPAGSFGAERGRPGSFDLPPDRPGAAAPGISATGSIASTFAGVAVSTFAC